MPFEGLDQVALIGKSALSRHTNQGQVSRFEQALGSLDALAQHKLIRTFSRCLTKQAGKVIGAVAGLLSQGLQRELTSSIQRYGKAETPDEGPFPLVLRI